jgi:hypothetical protein
MTTTTDHAQGRKLREVAAVSLAFGVALAGVVAACVVTSATPTVPMSGPGGERWGHCEAGHPIAGWAVGIDIPDGDVHAEQEAVVEAHYTHCGGAE